MKALVVAPHADDETLGCGGTALRLIDEGHEVVWCLVTEMRESDGYSASEVSRREELLRRVSESFGFHAFARLGFAAAKLGDFNRQSLIESLKDTIGGLRPDMLFLPFPGDAHSDHRFVFEAASAAAKKFRAPWLKRVLCYETLSETDFAAFPRTSGFIANTYYDVSATFERKLGILGEYGPELGEFPFPRSIQAVEALGKLRGAQAGVLRAEAFELVREFL